MKKDLPGYSTTLKRYRAENNLSQSELASKLNMSQQDYSSIERGYRKYLPQDFIQKMKKLGVNMDLWVTPVAMSFKAEAGEVDKLRQELEIEKAVNKQLRDEIVFLRSLVQNQNPQTSDHNKIGSGKLRETISKRR